MNTDFRLSTNFFRHPKWIKLTRKLGTEGGLSLIRLLAFVSTNNPTGNLGNMDIDDIAIAGDYQGDANEFVSTLVSVRYLDPPKGPCKSFCIHDFEEHNPWVAGAPARQEKAKKAAESRWGNAPSKHEQAPEQEEVVLDECSEHDLALPQASSSNAPILPLPSPSYPIQENPPKAPQGAGVADSLEVEVVAESPKAATPPKRRDTTVNRESRWTWLSTVKQSADGLADWFEREFWPEYPRHEDPKGAWTACSKLAGEWSADFGEEIMAVVDRYKLTDQWQDTTKVPHASTWFNQRRWEGEPPPKAPQRQAAYRFGGDVPFVNVPPSTPPLPPRKKPDPNVPALDLVGLFHASLARHRVETEAAAQGAMN